MHQVLLRPGENYTVAHAEGTRPFVMVMPTRRDTEKSRLRWQHFLETVAALRPTAALLLDNTPERSATEFVAHSSDAASTVVCVSDAAGPTDSLLIYRVRLASGLRIMMVHDDDWWVWSQTDREWPRSDASVLLARLSGSEPAVLPGVLTSWGKGRPFDGGSHMHSYFGAIRGDVWNGFADYALLTSRPSAFLDVALDTALQAAGTCDVLDGYSYQYSPGNWVTPAEIRANFVHYTTISGWGALAGVEAAVVERRLDSLAMIALFGATNPSDRQRTLADSVFLPVPAPTGARGIATRLPERIKLGLRASRLDSPAGFTMAHLRDLPAAYRSESQSLAMHRERLANDPAFAILVQVSRLASVGRVVTEGIPLLRSIAPDDLQPRIDVWEASVGRLDAS